ncbi:basic helix-loop-helix protein [Neopestalotiopsis sp. 37M]|nr:basic helix-loop-helix protein [Neopestalotiopsis sp. 37M]
MMESASYPHSEVANLEQLTDPRYLAAMAEAVTQEQSDYAAPSSTSPSRRKRSAPDSSPAESRRAKRGAASATMSNHADVEAAASYVESAVEAAQAAAAASVNAADFTALQQATQADHHESADPANASSTAAAALGSMYPTIHVPPTTEETFAAQAANENEHNSYGSNDMVPTDSMPDPSNQGPPQGPPQPGQNGLRSGAPVFQSPVQQPAGHRPAVGSEEWHKQRKDNHKEVERRRRETINEGINELAKIVPGCEKNKGSILQRAVSFITQLKENEAQNIEKWTLEKLLTEQAIQELSTSNDKLKQECERAYREVNSWKSLAQSHGLQLNQNQNQSKDEPSTSS